MFTKAVTMPRPWENIGPCILLSTMTITWYSAAKQHLMIHSLLNKTIWSPTKCSNVNELLLLSKSRNHMFATKSTKPWPYSLTKSHILRACSAATTIFDIAVAKFVRKYIDRGNIPPKSSFAHPIYLSREFTFILCSSGHGTHIPSSF